MSTQISSRSPAETPNPQRDQRVDQYVREQLSRTTQQVRFSDIATGLLVLVVFAMAFFFLAAVVDAWLWPLSTFARWIALATLVGGGAAITWFTLLPLLIRRINPHYAAKMIEDSRPGFKNSLLNYLELKRDKRPVHRAILNEVSKRAATDLSTVTIDSAVDKSNLIRIGFVLVGLVALSIAYLIFSPKSPLPTLRRVLAPGSKIAQPAAVSIANVMPGDASVFFGDRQEVSALISGVHDADDVRLVYSSRDGQIVDAVLPMHLTGTDGSYSAILETGPSGIQQSLTYRVQARDGVSPDYTIDVRPNPSITINSIKITPPGYTKLPARTLEGYGEIQAVEGANIEIAATANLPIEVAYIVPLLARDDSPENDEYRELRSIPMKSNGTEATGHFVAALNANRDRSLFTHYKIKFRSPDDFQNERANIFPVRVIADLAPEVEIVEPKQRELLIPVNQPFSVEIRAADLDYEISAVDLRIDHQGTQILDRSLHADIAGQDTSGPIKARLQLRPADLNLEPGDKAIMYATAADNRMALNSGLPDPNVSRTENYTLIITDPIDNPKQVEQPKPKDQPNSDDQQNNQQQQDNENGQTGEPDEDQVGDPSEGSANNGEPSAETEDKDQGDSESESESESDSNSGSADGNQESESTSAAQTPSESGQSKSGEPEADSKSESDGDPEGGNSSTNDSQEGSSSDKQNANGNQTDQPNEQDQRSQGGAGGQQREGDADEQADGTTNNASGGVQREPGDERGNSTDQDGENNGGASSGKEFRDRQLENGDAEPLDENAPEGDQFERLKEYVEQKQQEREKNSGRRATDDVDEQGTPELDEDQQSDDAKKLSADEGSRDAEPQESDASQSNQTADQRAENSDRQPGNPESGESNQQVRDGEPEQSVPNGSELDSGKPDESETGAGSESARDPNGEQTSQSNGRRESNEDRKPDSQSGNPQQPSETEASSSSADDSPEQQQEGQPSAASSQPAQGASAADGESSPGDSPSAPAENESTSESSGPQHSSQSPPNGEPVDSQKSESNSKPASDQQPGEQRTGGNASSNSSSSSTNATTPDKANLAYAKQVTDLILDELKDQQFEPDQELLDRMNWTQQDLQKFLQNWQAMKDNAKTGDFKSRQKYEDALRSLALERETKGRTVKVNRDEPFQLNEDGAVEQIPAEYVDRFNSFLKRRNRSKRNQ